MKLLVLCPVLKDEGIERHNRKELDLIVTPDISYEVRSILKGPASIESEFDDRIASPWVLEEVVKAEGDGFDAVLVSCMDDVATNAARELVRIPVIAPFQTCLAVASTLGNRIGVVTILENLVPNLYRKTREYGFVQSLAGVRSINVPVLEIDSQGKKVVEALVKESRKLVKDEHADSIILGCTGLVGLAKEVEKRVGVPVLDPIPVSVWYANLLVMTGLSHSPLAYHRPPAKLRRLPDLPGLSSKSLKLKA